MTTEMTKREVFLLCADALGYKARLDFPVDGKITVMDPTINQAHSYDWDPFADAKHRWECFKKLLEMDCSTDNHLQGSGAYFDLGNGEEAWEFQGPIEEFHARALAEVWRRKHEQ